MHHCATFLLYSAQSVPLTTSNLLEQDGLLQQLQLLEGNLLPMNNRCSELCWLKYLLLPAG